MAQRAKVCVMVRVIRDSYLEHVCPTHSYAFTPLHPCLYLAVSLQLTRPKDTEIISYQLCQDVHEGTEILETLILTFLLNIDVRLLD